MHMKTYNIYLYWIYTLYYYKYQPTPCIARWYLILKSISIFCLLYIHHQNKPINLAHHNIATTFRTATTTNNHRLYENKKKQWKCTCEIHIYKCDPQKSSILCMCVHQIDASKTQIQPPTLPPTNQHEMSIIRQWLACATRVGITDYPTDLLHLLFLCPIERTSPSNATGWSPNPTTYQCIVGYTMRDIRYKWNEGPNSVGVSSEVSLPQFKVLGHRQRAMEISLTTGTCRRSPNIVVFIPTITTNLTKDHIFQIIYAPLSSRNPLYSYLYIHMIVFINYSYISFICSAISFHAIVCIQIANMKSFFCMVWVWNQHFWHHSIYNHYYTYQVFCLNTHVEHINTSSR